MNNWVKNIGVWLVIGIVLMMLFMQVSKSGSTRNDMDYSTMMQEAAEVAAMGIAPEAEVMAAREAEIHEEATARVAELARERIVSLPGAV